MDTLADTAQVKPATELCAAEAREATRRVFGRQALLRWSKGPQLWLAEAPDLCPAALLEVARDVRSYVLALLFGTEAAAAQLRAAADDEGAPIRVLPMYVLCYIFDGDELDAADMEECAEETAQYSVHCVGLVMERKSKTLVVCVSTTHIA